MFERVARRGPPARTVSIQDVRAAEQRLEVTFPRGFEEYLSEVGIGYYLGVVIAFHPHLIEERVQENLELWAHAFYWDNPELLSQADLAHCVEIAGTIEGDQIVVHAQRPDHVYVLPRQHWIIQELPADFPVVLEWIVRAGVLYVPELGDWFMGVGDPDDPQA